MLQDAAGAAGSAFFLTSPVRAASPLPQPLVSVSSPAHRSGNLLQRCLVTNVFIPASALDQRNARRGFLRAMFFLPVVYQVFIINKQTDK